VFSILESELIVHIDKYTIIINDTEYDRKKDKHLPRQQKIEVDQCLMFKNLGRILDEFQDSHRLYGDIEVTVSFTETENN